MGIFSDLGRFFFGGPGKDVSTSTTQDQVNKVENSTVNPWSAAMPQLQSLLSDLGTLYGPNGAPQISPYEQQGYAALQGVANGPQATTAAINETNKTLSGQYLTPDTNPYLADIARRVGAKALQTTNTTFGGMGRTGSGLHQQLASEGVGNALTDLYGHEYDAERGRMLQAAGLTPQLQAAQYLGPQALITAGQNISARPFDIAAQRSSILDNIARLGSTTNDVTDLTSNQNTWSTDKKQAESSGLVGNFIKKLFS